MLQTFAVPGRPVPLPRMTRRDQYLSPPRPCVGRYRRYADDIRAAVTGFPVKRCDTPAYRVKLEFVFGDHETLFRIDLDNLCKGVLDALFADDSGVTELDLVKRLAAPGEAEQTRISLTS